MRRNETNKSVKDAARRSYRSMWPNSRAKRHRHKRRSKMGGAPSSTAGQTKEKGCKATPFDRFCAKYSRARHHPDYQSWLDSHRDR